MRAILSFLALGSSATALLVQTKRGLAPHTRGFFATVPDAEAARAALAAKFLQDTTEGEGCKPVPIESSPGLNVDGDFVLLDDPEPRDEELSNKNMLRILLMVATDDQVNQLVWKCLGYRKHADGEWDNEKCFPKWRDRFPEPPDLIGLTRIFSKEVDGPVMKANQALVRSVPMQYKQSIRDLLRPEGFYGFKLEELTPTKTRRAQCANWLLYYRQALYGISLEELMAKKAQDVEAENLRLREAGQNIKSAKGPELR